MLPPKNIEGGSLNNKHPPHDNTVSQATKKEGKAIASGFQQTIKAKMLLYFIPWLLFKY